MGETLAITKRITILFPDYYNPIWDLYCNMKSKPGRKDGYPQSIILLCDALLESFLVRLTYDNNTQIKDVDQFFYNFCKSNGLISVYDAYSEICIVRNTIAHNHLWRIDLSTDIDNDELIQTPAGKIYGHDNKKYQAYVDINSKKTNINGLSIIPDMLSLDDVNIILKLVVKIMREVYKVEREKGHHSICPDATLLRYNGKIYSFAELIDEFVE